MGAGGSPPGGRRGGKARPAALTRRLALWMRGSTATAVIPRDGRAGTGFLRKAPTPGNPSIAPRARAPALVPRERATLPLRAVPLGPGRPALASGRPAIPVRRRIGGAPAEPVTGRVVSLTLTPTRVREDAAEAPPQSSGSTVLTGLTGSPPAHPPPPAPPPGPRREGPPPR